MLNEQFEGLHAERALHSLRTNRPEWATIENQWPQLIPIDQEIINETQFIANITSLGEYASVGVPSFYQIQSEDRQTTEWERLAGQLRQLPNLHPNWDGYGGVPPHPKAVELAIVFLNKIRELFEILRLPEPEKFVPRPSLAGSGEVGIYWGFDEHGFYGDIGFFADGRMNCYMETKDGRKFKQDSTRFDPNNLPERLVELLKHTLTQQK